MAVNRYVGRKHIAPPYSNDKHAICKLTVVNCEIKYPNSDSYVVDPVW